MNRKVLYASLILTGAAVVGAVAAVTVRQSGVATVTANAPAFPALAAAPETVSKITIDTGKETFRLVRGEKGWTSPDRHGYAASPSKVRELLAQLGDMKIVEAKTAKPDLFARIGVDGPEKARETQRKTGETKRVQIEGKDGAKLVDVVLGERIWRQTGAQRNGTFIRREGEQQAYLASGGLFIADTLVNWLDNEITNVTDEEIARVEVTLADGASYAMARAGADGAFAVDGSDKPLDTASVNRLAGGFARLEFEDVKPAADMALPAPLAKAVYTTKDGLKLTIELAKVGEERWARIAVATAEGAAESAAKAAEKTKARVAGWVFKLPTWTYDRMTIAKDAMFKKEGTS